MKNTYFIPSDNFEKFEKKMNSIIKKSAKYPECNIIYKDNGIVYKEVEVDKEKVMMQFHEVEVDGTVRANGWRFVATLEHSENYGNIIRSAVKDDELEVPAFYRTCKCTCDHCKTNRRRNETFVIYNEEADDWKQVGRNCLQEYTNGLSTNAVAAFEQFLHEAEEFEQYPSVGNFVHFYAVEEVLLMAAELVKLFGYVKTYDEDGYANPDCTKDRTWKFIRHIEGHPSSLEAEREFVEDYLDKIDTNRFETVKLVEDAINWIENTEINSNYLNNLYVIVKSRYVDYKNFGILVSLIPTYNRELAKQEKREAEKRKIAACPSKFVGEIKQRITFTPENVKTVAGYDTIYGYTFIHQFKDEDGNIYIWRTGVAIPNPEEVKGITGTIKAHNEFRGIKQTELTRCKLQMVV